MEELTYDARVVPQKFSKLDKRGGVPCKEKMTAGELSLWRSFDTDSSS